MNNENLNITNENDQENITNQFNIPSKPEKSEKEQKEFDALLMMEYIGKNYKKIIKNNFSIPGFIFGPLYLIYRKLYIGIPLYFLFSLLIFFFINNLVMFIVILILQFIINIVIAFNFKKMYMNRVYNDCMEIQEKNIIRADEDIINLCKEKGEKNTFCLVLIIIILSLVSFALSNSLKTISNINSDNSEEVNVEKIQNNNDYNTIEENQQLYPENLS